MIAQSAARRPAVLVVFDLLQIGDDDLRALPLFERRMRLHQHIQPVPGIKIIEHIETHGEPLFHAIVDGDHEGIVAKRTPLRHILPTDLRRQCCPHNLRYTRRVSPPHGRPRTSAQAERTHAVAASTRQPRFARMSNAGHPYNSSIGVRPLA